MLNDFKISLRQLRKSPGFAITAILTLALGIGSTTAIFTLVYDVMLKPLPFTNPDRLVTIQEKVAEWSNVYPTLPVSANHFSFWQQHNRTFKAMAVMRRSSAPLGAPGRPLQIGVLSATPGLFAVLQVGPRIGRSFVNAEAQSGHDRVAVLMFDLWRNQFASDPAIIGKSITLNGFPYTVVGVMPGSFHMPSDSNGTTFGETDASVPLGVIVPLTFSKDELAEQMGELDYFGLGRLKRGVSMAAVTADLDSLQHTISVSLPENEKSTLAIALLPLQDELVGSNRKPLVVLLGAVIGLLLVGCVNIANLLLARAVGRRQEMAVAAALGASRLEMVLTALREIAVLAAAGGLVGVLLAAAIVPAMQHYLPPALDFRGSLQLDWAGAACAVASSLIATALAGLAPVLMVARTAPHAVLHSETRLASESRTSRRARRMLVSAEVAVSLVLVLMTGLLTATVVKLMHVDRGFAVERTITAMVDLPQQEYPDRQHRARFYRDVLAKLNRLQGVRHAAITSVLPLTGDFWGDIARVPGDNRPWTQIPTESFRWISPEYFSTIQMPLLSGRFFSDSDWGRNLAIVSSKTAQTLWPHTSPIGKQFTRAGNPDELFTVVGVVTDARTISLAKVDPRLIYVPYWFRCDDAAGLLVRTDQDPALMSETIRQTIWQIDRSVPVPAVRALGSIVADSVANQRFEMHLLVLFAASALFLAGLGVYGIVSYSVVQRYREIGLRMALGAQRGNVYRLILGEGLLPVVAGIVIGLGVATAVAQMMTSILFGISPSDPLLTFSSAFVLLGMGTAACLMPARRASSLEPMQALRTE